jgi:hypothetical protein
MSIIGNIEEIRRRARQNAQQWLGARALCFQGEKRSGTNIMPAQLTSK